MKQKSFVRAAAVVFLWCAGPFAGTAFIPQKIDALWWQKYQAVRDGREMEVAQCYYYVTAHP
jgi:hypothetical protein